MIITLGNQPSGEGGGAIYDMQADGALSFELLLDEQGNQNLPSVLPTGETFIVGSDPAYGDDWSFGNLYVKSGEVWQKKRTIPLMLHGFGQCVHNGKIYVAGGAHDGTGAEGYNGRVYWSDDLGDTWESSYVCYYRVRDIISFSGKLWVTTWEYYSPAFCFYRSDDDGLTWNRIESITPYQWPRMIIYNDALYVTNIDKLSMSAIDSGENITQVALPETMADQNNTANYLATIGGNLYALLGTNADHIWRYDGGEWIYYCDLGEECCSLLNFEDEFLIASTVGVDAKILKISA